MSLAGSVLGIAADSHRRFPTGPFIASLAYAVLIALPIAVYCYAVAPAWCTMYWVDPLEIPSWGTVLIFGAYPLLLMAGFLLARRIKGVRARLRLVAVPLLAIAALAVLFPGRLFTAGTMEEWARGQTTYLWAHARVAPVGIGGALLAFLVFLYLVRRFGSAGDHHWERHGPGKVSVAIVRCNGRIKEALQESLETWDGLGYLRRRMREKGNVVLLKPNIGGGSYLRPGTCTSPQFIIEAAEFIRETIPSAKLILVESDMIFWLMDSYLPHTPYPDAVRAAGIEFLNLSRAERAAFDFGGRLGVQDIPRILAEGAVLVDMPVPKTHAYFKLSGAIKNLFGLLPHPNKLLHYHARRMGDSRGEIFLDLYRCLPPDLVLVDGTVSGEGQCPLGSPKETGFIVTSPDALAVDLTLCRIMGLDPCRVPYLRKLCAAGAAPSADFPGLHPDEVKPAVPWRQASALVGLILNVSRLLRDHALIRSGATQDPRQP